MAIEAILKRSEVFLGLDDADLRKIASLPSCREVAFQPGEIVFRGGEEAKYLYVLKGGEIDLTTGVPTRPGAVAEGLVVDRITTGGFFGWSALVPPHIYILSAVCRKPSEAVAIDGAELMALFESDYHTGYRVFQSLSHVIGARLRDTEQTLASGRRWPFVRR